MLKAVIIPILMGMNMMHIRGMFMDMAHFFMCMRVAVFFGCGFVMALSQTVSVAMMLIVVAVPVLMGCFFMDMVMLMMLNCGKISAKDHDYQGQDKVKGEGLTENKDGEKDPDKRRYGIVGTGSCGSQLTLGLYVKIDAQPV